VRGSARRKSQTEELRSVELPETIANQLSAPHFRFVGQFVSGYSCRDGLLRLPRQTRFPNNFHAAETSSRIVDGGGLVVVDDHPTLMGVWTLDRAPESSAGVVLLG
jgi:hypothetical protein